MIGTPAVLRSHWASSARTAVLLGAAMLTASSCAAGAIAANDPTGTSFVSGSYNSKYLAPGGRPAVPPVTGTTLTGQRFSLAADRGEVVVLNFWESYCGPCRGEAPSLSALATHFAHDPVRFVGDDEDDSPAAAQAYEHTFDIGYPSLNDPGGAVALAFHDAVPPSAIPSTLVIDRTGHIAAIVVGGISYNGLKALIARVLAEKPAATS